MPCPCARGSPDPCHAGDPELWQSSCIQAQRARRYGRGCPVPTRRQAPTTSREPRSPDRRPEEESASTNKCTTPVVDGQLAFASPDGNCRNARRLQDPGGPETLSSPHSDARHLRCEPPCELRKLRVAAQPQTLRPLGSVSTPLSLVAFAALDTLEFIKPFRHRAESGRHPGKCGTKGLR